MLIYQFEDLQSQGLIDAATSTSELIFQGKKLIKSVSISKRFRQAAIDMCQKELDSGRLCIIVEVPTLYTLWKQKIDKNKIVKTKPKIVEEDIDTIKDDVQTIETESEELSEEFLKLCQEELNKYVGPISNYIMDDIMDEHSHITKKELISLICEEIPDSSQSESFKENILSQI